MVNQPQDRAVDDEDPERSPMADKNGPRPVHRKEEQDRTTRDDLPGDAVQPGINESTDDPN